MSEQPLYRSASQADPNSRMVLPLVVGCGVAVLLGVYGRLHEPTFVAVNLAGFSSGAYAKAWLATIAAALAVVQVLSAVIMYRGRSGGGAAWMPLVHRWSGRVAVLVTVPVAVHCLFALGFQADSPRVVAHSVLGCLFYGAFVTKMLSLGRKPIPGWALPIVGGAVFTALIGLWLTSSVWLFGAQGFKF